MNQAHTESIQELMNRLAELPGIGHRSAERLAYFILKQPREKALELSDAIRRVKEKIHFCQRCYNLSEQELCEICLDTRRDHSIVCVVEQPKDLICLEESGNVNWGYHVLQGHIAPLEGVTADHLTIDALVKRVRDGSVQEVVMATNPNLDGDGTALYIRSLLNEYNVRVTQLARGLPSGGSIEYANRNVLQDAIDGRKPME